MAHVGEFISWLHSHNWDEFPEFTFPGDIPGWCTPQMGAMLNYAVSECLDDGESYLELGSFCGRSLVAALSNNDAHAEVIDPQNLKVADKDSAFFWNRTVDDNGLRDRITLHRTTYQSLVDDLPTIGVFLVDGDHSSGQTYEAVTKLQRYLSNNTIVIFDDYLIYGGHGQSVHPDHDVEMQWPVKRDVDRWTMENCHNVVPNAHTPWGTSQLIVHFKR